MVVALPRPRVFAIFKIQVGELLIISRRGIIQNQRLQPTNATTSRKHLEAASHHAHLGNHFHADVDKGSKPASKDDDPQPICIGPAPNKMENGDRLKDNAVPKESMKSHS